MTARPLFEVLYTCAEPSCTAFVCELGDVCLEHQGMDVCPECHKTCRLKDGWDIEPYATECRLYTMVSECCEAQMKTSPVPFRYVEQP